MLDRAAEAGTWSLCSVPPLRHCAAFRIVAAVFGVLGGAGLDRPRTTVCTDARSSPVCGTMTGDKLGSLWRLTPWCALACSPCPVQEHCVWFGRWCFAFPDRSLRAAQSAAGRGGAAGAVPAGTPRCQAPRSRQAVGWDRGLFPGPRGRLPGTLPRGQQGCTARADQAPARTGTRVPARRRPGEAWLGPRDG